MSAIDSDGEIQDEEDFETISSGSDEIEFFKQLKHQIKETKRRKVELEVENDFANFEYRKENFKDNDYNVKWKNSQNLSSRSNNSLRRSAKKRSINIYKDNRNQRSLSRAPSIFPNRPILKRRNNPSKKARKRKRSRLDIEVSDNGRIVSRRDDESNDEELLELRLMALKTKAEIRNEFSNPREDPSTKNEEEELRIQALRSAILKKSEEIRSKKMRKKQIENDRPYSPSDQPESMDMILSPLGSPYNDFEENNQEIDMDISNSPEEVTEERESSDMEIDESPQQHSDEDEKVDDDEIALRAQLLISISKKKQEEKQHEEETKTITENLKLAAARLRKKQQPEPVKVKVPRDIKSILEYLKKKQKIEENKIEEIMRIENKKLLMPPAAQIEKSTGNQEISTEDQIEDSSTITDTKNIPIINSEPAEVKSRLVSSLESVIRPVQKLIINLNDDSDSEIDDPASKKVTKKVLKKSNQGSNEKKDFEAKLDSFLKNIREKHEGLSRIKKSSEESLSAVKHLPLSDQKEYQKLLDKMKFLENEKMKKLHARQLKRTKSNSSETSTKIQEKSTIIPNSETSQKESVIKRDDKVEKSSDKISNTLKKISLLDQETQQRLMIKTENNYKMHSETLFQGAKKSLRILQANEIEMNKHEKVANDILELEKQLKRQKANLNVINKRIKMNVNKFVQSQRELISFRSRQKAFEQNVCTPFGKMLKGSNYAIPKMSSEAKELNENYQLILDKVVEFQSFPICSNDQNLKNNFEVISGRLRRFLADKSSEVNLADEEPHPSPEPNEAEEKADEGPEIPEVNGVIASSTENGISAGMKLTYESPLDFMRVNNKKVEAMKILCPFQLEGMCDDANCTMMHIDS